MRYEFTITDEKTLENDTVKVVIQVNGPADAPRKELEERVRRAVNAFLPNTDWAFSGLTISTYDYPMFVITASVRIKAADNDDLHRRASNYAIENPDAKASIKVVNIDSSMPLFKSREGEQQIRRNIYKLALQELEILQEEYAGEGRLRLKSVSYSRADLSNKLSASTAYTSNAGVGGGSAIGSFEKLYQSATIVITDGLDEPQAEII